ncbi:MAG TPA: glycosyltransferase [Chlamydiales bacterium]|nr:glycosyltransferase [Chlamydiales bacterium]
MIVKDEQDVIERCLSSVNEVIDYWVIVDTGSKDRTQQIIRSFLGNIPGELHHRPWKNFEINRNQALELAQGHGDYILFMDADDVLRFEGEPHFEELTADMYMMWRGTEEFSYLKPQLVRSDVPWKWVGVTHEYLDAPQPVSSDVLSNVKYVSLEGGASHKDPKQKFLKNIALLTKALEENPTNGRYAFYLAESYRDADEPGKALQWFQKRIAMGGWVEETFWAKLQSALMLKKMGLSNNVVVEALLDAHRFRPHRLEPVYYLAEIWNQEEEYVKSYEFIKTAFSHKKPVEKDALFNMDWIDQYGLLFQLSICSYYANHYEESLRYCNQLLKLKTLPEWWRKQTIQNREFPLLKLQT